MNPMQAPNVGPSGKDFGNREPEPQPPTLTHISNDTYGKPRHVVHYLSVLTEDERERYSGQLNDRDYNLAVRKANKVGGRKFNNRQYGGGIMFYGADYEIIETVMKLRQQEGVGK